MKYDVAIIGAGPAGLSAALNLKLHNKNIIWFGSADLSIKVDKAEQVANYPGLSMVSGEELNENFRKQIKDMDLVITDKLVTTINQSDAGFMLLADNEVYEASALLLAMGAVSGKPYDGEEELLGRGVSYCATCDGYLYKGKTIAAVATSEKFEHEVKYLAELAEKIYLIPLYKDCSVNLPNVEIIKSNIKAINGDMRVSGMTLIDGREIAVDGVFLLRNAIAPTTLIKGLTVDGPHIVVNRNMETNIKGCFAAGDCTGRPYQIAKSVGEGNVAAHAILDILG